MIESIRRADEEQQHHARLKAEEEGRIVEKSRLKSEEEDLRLMYEDEARLIEDAMLKAEQEEQECLK